MSHYTYSEIINVINLESCYLFRYSHVLIHAIFVQLDICAAYVEIRSRATGIDAGSTLTRHIDRCSCVGMVSGLWNHTYQH